MSDGAAAQAVNSASRRDDFRGTGVWIVTLLVAAVHLAVAARYDFFRNELYFIVCGRHPAFGYVDQPPLIPLLAAGTQLFGINLFLLRLPAALAATALVPVSAAIARLLGGGRAGALIAAIAAGIAPGLMALTSNLGTATLEPLGWTVCAYFVLCAVQRGDGRALVWAGVAAGLSLEAKYGIAIWLVGLGIGVAAVGAWRLFAGRDFWLGALAAGLIAAPSLIWQALHGWPFLAIVAFHNGEGAHFNGTPLRFLIQQALAMNVVLAPLWLAGIVAPFVLKDLKPARVLSVAFIVCAVAIFAAHGKDYYLFPAYPALFAAGAVAAARLNVWLRWAWVSVAIANTLLVAPLMLPILSPPALHRLVLRIGPLPANESAAIGAPITQVFSDEFGWRDLEAKVAATYRGLPPAERAGTAIFASNYGEAAALDLFGGADGLPPASSGENQYFLWGPQIPDPRVLIVVNGDAQHWRPICTTLVEAGRFGARFAMPYENDRPILLCRGLHPGLAELWPRLKRFQ